MAKATPSESAVICCRRGYGAGGAAVVHLAVSLPCHVDVPVFILSRQRKLSCSICKTHSKHVGRRRSYCEDIHSAISVSSTGSNSCRRPSCTFTVRLGFDKYHHKTPWLARERLRWDKNEGMSKSEPSAKNVPTEGVECSFDVVPASCHGQDHQGNCPSSVFAGDLLVCFRRAGCAVLIRHVWYPPTVQRM